MPASPTVSTDTDPRKLTLEELGQLQHAQRQGVRKLYGGSKHYRRHKRAALETFRRKIQVPRKQAGLSVETGPVWAAFLQDPTPMAIAEESLLLAFLPPAEGLNPPIRRSGATLGQRRRAAATWKKKELKRRLREIDWGIPFEFVTDAPFETTRRGAPREAMAIRLLPHIGAVVVPGNTERYRKLLTDAGLRLMKRGSVQLIRPVTTQADSSGTAEATFDANQPVSASASVGPTQVRTRAVPTDKTLAQQPFDLVGLPQDRRGKGGQNVVIGVLDTGVYADHEQFAHKPVVETQIGPNGRLRPVTRYDHPHGTHVAALAAGRDGVAPNATLLSAKVLTDRDKGTNFQVAFGMNWLIETVGNRFADSPLVIVASLGTSDSELIDVIDFIVNDGLSVGTGNFAVAAAGNYGAKNDVDYPAALGTFVSVGALNPDGSVWPSTHQGGAGVDIFAPGVDIVSAGISGPASYLEWSGTSMATPIVAGVLARLLTTDPTYWVDQPLDAAVLAIRDETNRSLTLSNVKD